MRRTFASVNEKVDATLTGVSETALWTLRQRATEAARPDAIIDDPMAVALVDAIDADFAKFGSTRRQDMAVRALAFDGATRDYLAHHPSATVVALAEGLQTSYYRIAASQVSETFRWLTVDLPPIVDLRTRLLPPADRVTTCAQSALDFSWMDRVDDGDGVFITAEGLLMYLQPAEAMGLLEACAAHFPGGRMMFDLPPVWFSRLARRGLRTSLRYRVPPMPFGMSPAQAAGLVHTLPGVRAVHDVPLPAGRGWLFNAVARTIREASLLDPLRPSFTLLEFG